MSKKRKDSETKKLEEKLIEEETKKNERLLCPLFKCGCHKLLCAWYQKDLEQCAMLAMAESALLQHTGFIDDDNDEYEDFKFESDDYNDEDEIFDEDDGEFGDDDEDDGDIEIHMN
jgi:hypothetical protein